ncbi:MAG: 4-hydroxy-tetrahydrodipicolinate reductase [Myxococcota bacterium]
MSLRIAVLGAPGRMGRQVVEQVLRSDDLVLAAAIARDGSDLVGRDAGTLCGLEAGVPLTVVSDGLGQADVVVDFSLPEGTLAALPGLDGRPLVSGVTGFDTDALDTLHRYASTGPLLHAANFSTGVNVLLSLVAAAARALPDFDIEIVEAHHTRKVDAPSGTALALGRAAAEARGWNLDAVRTDGRTGRVGARPHEQIGIHALRAGVITGHHEVWLAGPTEQVQLVHTATSRDVFAAGALRAARWIAGRAPGTYVMADVLGLSGA